LRPANRILSGTCIVAIDAIIVDFVSDALCRVPPSNPFANPKSTSAAASGGHTAQAFGLVNWDVSEVRVRSKGFAAAAGRWIGKILNRGGWGRVGRLSVNMEDEEEPSKVAGFTDHGWERMQESGLLPEDLNDALKNTRQKIM
jgi:hypothetical protein